MILVLLLLFLNVVLSSLKLIPLNSYERLPPICVNKFVMIFMKLSLFNYSCDTVIMTLSLILVLVDFFYLFNYLPFHRISKKRNYKLISLYIIIYLGDEDPLHQFKPFTNSCQNDRNSEHYSRLLFLPNHSRLATVNHLAIDLQLVN